MADSTSIEQPFPIFFDKAGKPLDSGYVYIGEYGKNPQTNPIQAFWDEALTQPAVQPIRTINGYYSRYGTPSRVFIQGISCSITVRDKYQIVVYSELKTSGKVAGLINASVILDDSGQNQQQINDKSITTVNSISDLIAIQNPKDGQVVFVKSIEKNYTYTPSTTEIENGVTVVNKWIMEIQDVYYASWFAQTNTKTDQSLAIQIGYAYATSKGRPFIIDGHFYVDSTNPSGDFNGNMTALKTLSNSVMWFTPNGKLEHLPTSLGSYNIIHTFQVENYVIHKPVLIGERDTHTGASGEWGYLLTIYQSKNGYIHQPVCNNAWGDGIYIGKAAGTPSDDMPENITVFEPRINRARRNGISFTAGNLINIIRPYVSNTNGIAPEAGIDIEPEEISAGQAFPAKITNSIIESPTFIDNARNIWVSWYGANRSIDLQFTGTTKIVGGNYPLTIYARSFAANDVQYGVIHFNCIDYTCTNSNGYFETELMFEDRGATVEIDSLIIRKSTKWTTHFVRFGDLNKALKGLIIHKIESTTLQQAVFTTTSVQGVIDTLLPSVEMGFKDNVVTQTDQDNAVSIRYGDSKIGGYSLKTSATRGNSYNYPSNNIIAIPYPDAYISLSGDFRKLKIGIDATSAVIDRTLYIRDVSVELPNASVKNVVTLQGKGGWLGIKNNPTGRGGIYGSYGIVS